MSPVSPALAGRSFTTELPGRPFTALKTSVLLCSPQAPATTELLTLSTVLPFLESLVIGIIKCVGFSH